MKYVILSVLLFIVLIYPYTISIVVDPAEGEASIDSGMVSYFYPYDVDGSFILDSFSVELVDVNGMSDTALYKVIVIPREEINYYVLPNPMVVSGNNADELSYDVLNYLNLSAYKYQHGSAILLSTRLDLDLQKCHGVMTIFDAVGNAIARDLPMEWLISTDNKRIGVAVWNGRNLNGRIVGSGAYVVFIDANLQYDIYSPDGVQTELKHVVYKVMVGVKYK